MVNPAFRRCPALACWYGSLNLMQSSMEPLNTPAPPTSTHDAWAAQPLNVVSGEDKCVGARWCWWIQQFRQSVVKLAVLPIVRNMHPLSSWPDDFCFPISMISSLALVSDH